MRLVKYKYFFLQSFLLILLLILSVCRWHSGQVGNAQKKTRMHQVMSQQLSAR